jgi:hypothetical protein
MSYERLRDPTEEEQQRLLETIDQLPISRVDPEARKPAQPSSPAKLPLSERAQKLVEAYRRNTH